MSWDRNEPMSGQLPSLWRVAYRGDEGRREHLVVARNGAEAIDMIVEPDHRDRCSVIERVGTIPFGPGVIR